MLASGRVFGHPGVNASYECANLCRRARFSGVRLVLPSELPRDMTAAVQTDFSWVAGAGRRQAEEPRKTPYPRSGTIKQTSWAGNAGKLAYPRSSNE
jgi:hypothetical protein